LPFASVGLRTQDQVAAGGRHDFANQQAESIVSPLHSSLVPPTRVVSLPFS
jgi:hypothetical protein